MSTEERIDKRLADLEAMVFGIRGEGGLVHELAGLRTDFKEWRREERGRREGESDKRVLAARAMVLAMGAGLISLLAVIVTLIGMVVVR